jgi:hypothetical protein
VLICAGLSVFLSVLDEFLSSMHFSKILTVIPQDLVEGIGGQT